MMREIRLTFLCTLLSLVVTRSLCCSRNVVQPCDSTTFNSQAEYVITANSQSVCLTTNSSAYSSSSAAIIHTQSVILGQFCSSVYLSSSLICASNVSDLFPDHSVLFISLSELANLTSMGSVDFNFTNGSNLETSFTLNYAPKGVYPSQISPLTRSPGNVINFEWIGYDTTPVSYSHLPTGGSFPDLLPINFLNLTWSPPCISPATMNAINFTLTPSVPRRALIGLNPAQVESDGMFSIHWSGGERSSVQLIIEETDPPTLITSGDTVRVQINQSANIECDIQFSVRRPSWYFNNVPITDDDNSYSIRESELSISLVTVELGGWYTCVASNSIGTIFKDFLVIPVDMPKIVVSKPFPGNIDYSVYSGTSLVLPCSATGTPPPQIAWFADSNQLVNGSGKVRIDATSGALIISNYTEEDRPMNGFMCRASNVAGSVNSSVINVAISNLNSVLNQPFPVFNIHSNESVSLSCPSVSGNQVRKWYKDGVDFIAAGNMTNWVVTGSSSGSTGGVYCCRVDASSQANESIANCYIVNVKLPSSISNLLVNNSVQEGRNATYFIATETGNNLNLPVLSWYYNGTLLNDNSQQLDVFQDRVGVSTLKIRASMSGNSGLYSVRGQNVVNTVESLAELRVVDSGCNNNTLRSADGEGPENTVRRDWGITPGATLQRNSAEVHFVLSANASNVHPTISQTVPLSYVGNMKALVSCRMRATDPSSGLPRVTISVPNTDSTTISLPFNTLTSWQWVATEMRFTTNISSNITVTMEIYGDSATQASVLFDDFCLSVVPFSPSPSSSPTQIPTAKTTSFPSSPTKGGFPLGSVMIIGIGIAGGAFLCALVLGIMACCCFCFSRRKARRKKTVLMQELSDSLKKRDSDVKENGTPLAVKSEDQPVYILPGETPIYLDTDVDKGTNSPIPIESQAKAPPTSSVPNIDSSNSYDYARSPLVGSAPNHVLHQSPLSTPPATARKSFEKGFSTSNDPTHKSTLFVKEGNVERLSKIFEGKKEDAGDTDGPTVEKNVYETFDSDTEQANSPSKRSITFSVLNSSNSPSTAAGNTRIGKKQETEENEYETCTPNTLLNSPRSVGSPTPSNSSRPSIVKPNATSSASITTMPLPSIPTEEDRQEVYENVQNNPNNDPPVDSHGYLALVGTKKNEEQGEDTYENPNFEQSDEPFVDRNGKEIRMSPDGYTSIQTSQLEDSSYSYCDLIPKSKAHQDDVYAVPSLDDNGKMDAESLKLLGGKDKNDSDEHIYY